MRVGWSRPGCLPDQELGSDDQAFVFDGFKVVLESSLPLCRSFCRPSTDPPLIRVFRFPQVQRWHQGNEHFGRAWQTGDVVGCMVDLNEHTMMFTLNGEVLLDDSGSELAFKDFDVGEGQTPIQFFLSRRSGTGPLTRLCVQASSRSAVWASARWGG